MTIAQVIITDALKELQVISEDETPSATMLSDGLRMLNRLLETLSQRISFAPKMTTLSKTLAGETSLTIGPTGVLVGTRPISIESAYVQDGDITYPVTVVKREQWDELTYKTEPGDMPATVFYDGTYPDGTLYLNPVSSGKTLVLRAVAIVKSFASLSAELDLPPGYEDAIMLRLAIRMAPGYGVQVSPEIKLAARNAMSAIKKTNLDIPILSTPFGGGDSLADFMAG